MPAPDTTHEDLTRQLSKLIAALDRQRMEELGVPAAADTAEVLRKVHGLLTQVTSGKPADGPRNGRLDDYLGRDWVEENPWSMPYLSRIGRLLTTFPGKPPTDEHDDSTLGNP